MKNLCLLVVALTVCIVPATLIAQEASPGLFPLGSSMVGDGDLPLPFGVGATLHYQDQEYSLTRMSISVPGFDLADTSGLDIDNHLFEGDVKLDLWLLPFLNVFGLVGVIDGETEVDLSTFQLGNLTIDYDGIVYGAGITLAGGFDNVFASFTALFTDTDLDQAESSVEAWVLTPRVGVKTSLPGSERPLALWSGAMYQSTEEQHRGNISIPQIGPVVYDVELEEDNAWCFLVGAAAEVTDHWNVELEVGAGDRSQVTLSATCRF